MFRDFILKRKLDGEGTIMLPYKIKQAEKGDQQNFDLL